MSARVFDLLSDALAIAALAAGACLWLRSTRALRRGGAVERGLDGALMLSWLGVVVFFVLAAFGAFQLWIAAGVLIATGFAARFPAPASAAAASGPSDSRLEQPDFRDPFLWSALPVSVIALTRLVKGMIAPPMAWDAMTMHLPKAAFWIQSGSLTLPDFPDAWTYYRWFPAGGEILFSWIMLPTRSDLLLGPFGFLVWLGLALAGARLARVLGAENQNAWLGGAALAALPAALVFMTANYVDSLAAVFVLLGLTHALRFWRAAQARNGLLALAAAGLAVSVKTSGVVLAVPIVAAVGVTAWRNRRELGRGVLVLLPAAAALPCSGYLWTWLHTGSPFYPVKAPGLPLPHHQGLADLFSGKVFGPGALSNPGWSGFAQLFHTSGDAGHMNFGFGGAVLAVAAAAALVLTWRRARSRAPLVLCLAGAVLMTPLVVSAGNLALRTVWIGVLGRHLLPAWAPFALQATLLPGKPGKLVLAASVLVSGLHFLPMGWSDSMHRPALMLTGLLAGGLTIIWSLWRRSTGSASVLRWSASALVALLFLGAWTALRDAHRHSIYRETSAQLGAFDAHPIHPTFATAASLWRLLDDRDGKTIAVTVGPDRVGHNQFFYPLLGSRLQNRLLYIPTSSDPGELVGSARDRYARAQPRHWLDNLQRSSPDLVVGLWQATPERDWLAAAEGFEVTALTDLGVPWIGRRAHIVQKAGSEPGSDSTTP